MKRLFIMMLLTLGLSACANPYVNKFAQANNWVGLAYYDVEFGQQPRSVQDLSKLGAVTEADKDAYLKAYKEYMVVYCQPDNAYRAGILGKSRNAVCIDNLPTGAEYQANWLQGLEQSGF